MAAFVARFVLVVALWALPLVSNAANELVWARVNERGWRVLLEERPAGILFLALLISSALVAYLTT